MSEPVYTYEQVRSALNRAANDIIEQAELWDSGTVDALNLLVNAAGAYLTGEAETLSDVAESGYSAPLAEILHWIGEG